MVKFLLHVLYHNKKKMVLTKLTELMNLIPYSPTMPFSPHLHLVLCWISLPRSIAPGRHSPLPFYQGPFSVECVVQGLRELVLGAGLPWFESQLCNSLAG